MIEDIKSYFDLMYAPEIALWVVLGAALIGWIAFKAYDFIRWQRVHKAKLEACRQYWRDIELEPGRTDWREIVPPKWTPKE